jgi:hypothetical protein
VHGAKPGHNDETRSDGRSSSVVSDSFGRARIGQPRPLRHAAGRQRIDAQVAEHVQALARDDSSNNE